MSGQGVTKRLRQELMGIMMAKDASMKAFPEGDNLFQWKATIVGAEGTCYADLKYKLTIKFPTDYPYTAPTVTFDTPCFHPNVDTHGNICLDILKEKWSPSYDVRTVLLSIQSLLADPNVDSPLNCHAAELWSNPALYKEKLSRHYEENVRSRGVC
ncbi:ubiquitin-conjugating enzyme E2C isoform 4 [Salpingoeca rosetta]|uniref:Ubiquitin-conjugating enzyme E2C isoform 4 n=1 Tax=Salpingoeca rosetta (strain ATCC 50818 / BSB-021) TaxID=946362 RepID=F2U6N5_SALR5|nr:ubiquitin-conjugating enzyme E2C isoform 4 [Salpingoeca rosetta]EGD83517.1 ubiquitin-conjugating enzyme E2C isoform 4 [Salpingoeca rosetta]|eukprot:XP_004995021.1 ubiquitin-conjugating enzyme E2C isoform 4 [Salpingoeca rosetta]